MRPVREEGVGVQAPQSRGMKRPHALGAWKPLGWGYTSVPLRQEQPPHAPGVDTEDACLLSRGPELSRARESSRAAAGPTSGAGGPDRCRSLKMEQHGEKDEGAGLRHADGSLGPSCKKQLRCHRPWCHRPCLKQLRAPWGCSPFSLQNLLLESVVSVQHKLPPSWPCRAPSEDPPSRWQL